jgi:hypothetical protein
MSETGSVSFFQFVYRVNPDKTIDAICAFCFLTAATAENEADLHAQESAHKCWETKARQQPEMKLQ